MTVESYLGYPRTYKALEKQFYSRRETITKDQSFCTTIGYLAWRVGVGFGEILLKKVVELVILGIHAAFAAMLRLRRDGQPRDVRMI